MIRVPTVKTAEVVARQIVQKIVTDGLGAGDPLPPEHVMLAAFKVGRTSVREALRLLEVQGVVTLKRGPGGGPIVADNGSWHFAQTATLHLQRWSATLQDLLAARLVVEPALAGMAARADADWSQLRDNLAAARTLPADRGMDLFAVFRDFHRIVEQLSGNAVMRLWAASMRDIFRAQAAYDPFAHRSAEPGPAALAIREHERIADALITGRAAPAERLMRNHLARMHEQDAQLQARLSEPISWT